MTDEQVQNAVTIAIESVKAENPALDFGTVHERSTAHRLAVQLESHFNTWNVDCEYDHDGQLQKSLMGIAQCNSRKATNEILPDIIVHHRRGEGRDHNLLVVELKKYAEEDACDKRKLELLTAPNGHYQSKLGADVPAETSSGRCCMGAAPGRTRGRSPSIYNYCSRTTMSIRRCWVRVHGEAG